MGKANCNTISKSVSTTEGQVNQTFKQVLVMNDLKHTSNNLVLTSGLSYTWFLIERVEHQ